MCGICGIVELAGPDPSRADVESLRDAVAHRGPDAAGLHLEPGVGLGACRLSVVDLSPRGHMPMSNEDQTLWITYNGEVYNFVALRAQLEERGHRFRSDTDTEVVLHAYREWGDACAERLSGMFAFAIWDRTRRRVFAARDRLGVKPFFYLQRGSRLVFVSEVHALYPFAPPTRDTLDVVALDFFLSQGFCPPDRPLVRDVSALPPAHTLVFDEAGLRVSRYWEVRFRPTRHLSRDDALEALDHELDCAVRRRLRSDVALGCFLSGGIDSGLVTALAARASDQPVRTFCVGFAGGAPTDDERPLARQVAERYGTQHSELEVRPDQRSLLTQALWHVGEPFADIGLLPMLEISRAARAHITVALSGDGGDESFAGYGNVRAAMLAERLRRLVPGTLRRFGRAALGRSGLESRFARAASAGRWLDTYVESAPVAQLEPSNGWTRAWRERLYPASAREQLAGRGARDLIARVLDRADELGDAECHLFADLHLRLPAGYLTKVDIASSMVALEVRSPFLDFELVEFAASLPLELKLLDGQQKGLLRQLALRYLPGELVHQPKRGFAPRLDEWLREGWSDLARDLLLDSHSAAAGLFDPRLVSQVLDDHLSGRQDHGQRLWTLICFEIWWRLFVDRTLHPGDALGA